MRHLLGKSEQVLLISQAKEKLNVCYLGRRHLRRSRGSLARCLLQQSRLLLKSVIAGVLHITEAIHDHIVEDLCKIEKFGLTIHAETFHQ